MIRSVDKNLVRRIRDKKMPCVVVRRSPMQMAECLEGVELEDMHGIGSAVTLIDDGGVLTFAAKCWVTKEQWERIQDICQADPPSHWMQEGPRSAWLADYRFATETMDPPIEARRVRELIHNPPVPLAAIGFASHEAGDAKLVDASELELVNLWLTELAKALE